MIIAVLHVPIRHVTSENNQHGKCKHSELLQRSFSYSGIVLWCLLMSYYSISMDTIDAVTIYRQLLATDKSERLFFINLKFLQGTILRHYYQHISRGNDYCSLFLVSSLDNIKALKLLFLY